MYPLQIESLHSWDDAIRKAKRKIAELHRAIKIFKENKESGEPWFIDEKAGTD